MVYRNADDQKELLQKAMNKLNSEGNSDAAVVKALYEWLPQRDHSKWPELTEKTYWRYRTNGIKKRKIGELIFNFLCEGPKDFRVLSPDGLGSAIFIDDISFVGALRARFGTRGSGLKYEQIQSLAHSYEMYRRSWQVVDGKHFVRSLLKIELENGIYRITEVQKFNIGKKVIEEVDEGFVFPYSTNFFAITNSHYCMKFYDFHDLYPEPENRLSVNEIKGNMIAVAGKGEHPSFRFYARRVKGAVDIGHYSVDEFSNQDDMSEIFKYIFK